MGRDVFRFTVLSAALLVGLTAGCNEMSDAPTSAETADGWRRGELAVYIADGVDGHSETSYYLRDTLGGANFDTKLVFDSAPAPELVTGVRLKLRGVDGPDGLRVTDYALLPAPASETTSSELIGAAAYPVRNFAFVLINLNGNGVNTTADNVMGRLIGNADSIRNYYLADSYGTQDITAQVFGPLNYTMPIKNA